MRGGLRNLLLGVLSVSSLALPAEGRRVRDVIFHGNETFEARELLQWCELQPAVALRSVPFDAGTWDRDTERIRDFYAQEGFDQVRVAGLVDSTMTGVDDVDLHFLVAEGPRWSWARVRLEVLPFRTALRDSLVLDLPAGGEPARWRALPDIGEALRLRVAELGFHEAEVEFLVRRDPGSRLADLRVHVETGSRTRAAEVVVLGLDKTRPEVVRREVTIREGAPILLEEVRRTEKRLLRLGIFEEVQVRVADAAVRPGWRDVEVIVRERAGGRLGTGFGYGSIDRLHLNAGVEQANLAGRAVRLRLGGNLGTERRRLEAGAFLPWILQRRVGLRLAAFYEKEFPSRFEVERQGAEASLVRELEEDWKLEVGYRVQRVRLLRNRDRIEGDGADGSPLRIGDISAALSRDTRNRLLGPTRGAYLRVSQEWVAPWLGSGEHFSRTKAQVWGHLPIGRGFFAHGRVLFGILRPQETGNEIPTTERFFAGGTADLRGFPGDGIGPQDPDGTPRGGRILLLTGAELELHLYGPAGIAAFLDAGQLADEGADVRLGLLSVGAGGGLRWRSPIGFARLDLGFPLTDRYGGSPRFHFSTGSTFF